MNARLSNIRIGIIGLGYVGLPLAVEFAKRYQVIGFDIKKSRIDELRLGLDHTLEVESSELTEARQLAFSSEIDDMRQCNVFIVTVPTPVDHVNRPDFTPLVAASKIVGSVISKGAVVIYESTVYPGATEEICVPLLEKNSGLTFNLEFFAGYSPERINPGDKQHRLPSIKKVTSGSTLETADFVDALYASIITAGTHKAPSIKVAEAAKVIENTQRDLNIALMNELALIFQKIGIDTTEELEAMREEARKSGSKQSYNNKYRPKEKTALDHYSSHRHAPTLDNPPQQMRAQPVSVFLFLVPA